MLRIAKVCARAGRQSQRRRRYQMSETKTTKTKAPDSRSRAAAELDDADPFGAGPRARRSRRSSVLWGFVGLVAVGAVLQTTLVLLRRADPPPRSFIAQLAPN